jgi:hypothetical protein
LKPHSVALKTPLTRLPAVPCLDRIGPPAGRPDPQFSMTTLKYPQIFSISGLAAAWLAKPATALWRVIGMSWAIMVYELPHGDLTRDDAGGGAEDFESREAITLLRRLLKSHAEPTRLAPNDEAGVYNIAVTDRQLELVGNSQRNLELEARPTGREIENNTIDCCGASAEGDCRRHAHTEAVMISSLVQNILLNC